MRIKHQLRLIAVLACACLCRPDLRGNPDESFRSIGPNTLFAKQDMRYLCGVNATYAALRMNNIKADYNAIFGDIYLPDKKVSLGEISEYLNSSGLKNKPLRISLDGIANSAPGSVFIVYFEPGKNANIGHFCIFKTIERKNIQVIDPPNPVDVIEYEKLVKAKKLTALALGDQTSGNVAYAYAGWILIAAGIILGLVAAFMKGK